MRRLLISCAALALLTACSSGGDDGGGVTPPIPQSINLQLGANSATVARGSATQVPVTLTRVGSYAGTVSLRADNLPTGVTASFSSAQLTGSSTASTLTLDATSTAVAGTTAITVRATGSGVTDATASFSLVITVPPPAAITLVAGSSTATAAQGAAATVPLAITRSGGFAGAVDLTAEGLPAGVTASFAPASLGAAVTASTLTLTAAATATPGTNSIVVRASGTGVTAQTATIAFTVTSAAVANFALTATPASLSVTAGQGGTSAIALTRSGGFTGNVQFSLVGAPAGVTGVFAPNPTNTNASTLTLSTTAAAVPGTYNLTVLGQGTLPGFTALTDRTTAITLTVAAPPGLTVSLGAPTVSVAAGANATNSVSITRIGGFTGDVTLALENAPAGVTGTFAPATIGAAASTSTLTLTLAANTAVGSYTLTVRAIGTGVTAQTATFALNVTAAPPVQGYTLAASSVTAQQGTTGTSTVSIARTGNFAGTVNLAVSGLPSGVTASFNPAAATGTSSALSLVVSSGAAVGSYTATVTGTATGLSNVTTSVPLTITAANTGGGGNIAFRFCAANTVPTFFAYRSGTSGAWTAVTPSNNTFSFSLSASVGQVAYAQPNQSNTQMTVLNYAASEFPNIANAQCLTNPNTKTVTGVVAGLGTGQTATVSVGGASAMVSANGAFTIVDATDGTTDLIATRTGLNLMAFTQAVDRVIIRRGINPSAGGSVGATIDFGAAEAVAPASGLVTVNNVAGETVTAFTSFQTANGASGAFFNFNLTGAQTSPFTLLGAPSNLTQSGDFHLQTIVATAPQGGSNANTRTVIQYNRDLAARTIALGSAANAPTYTTVATSPYVRIRVQGQWQADYGDIMSVVYGQGNARAWSITTSRAFAGTGAASYDAEIPDLSGVSGFNNAWGLVAATSTLYSINVYSGFTGLTAITEGTTFRIATRSITQTP